MTDLKFNFTLDETNLILVALSKQPFETSAPLVQKIQQQYAEQEAEKEKAPPVKTEPKRK